MAVPATAQLGAVTAHQREAKAIIYDPAAMESMRHAAQDAFDADTPAIVGLLLGRRRASGLSVTSWTLAAPGLAPAIQLARERLPNEEILGWFRTKHQGEPRLTTAELEAAQRAFGVPPLALVLRPSGQRPLRIASYLPARDGQWAGERPLQEFFLYSPEIPLSPSEAPQLATAPVGFRWIWAGATLLLAALAFLFVQLWPTAPARPPRQTGLRVEESGSQRILHWQADASTQRATLIIGRVTTTLPATQYHLGAFVLPPESTGEDLDVLLRVESADRQVSESRLRLVALPPAVKALRPRSGNRRRGAATGSGRSTRPPGAAHPKPRAPGPGRAL